jgi:HEAT repeat protein
MDITQIETDLQNPDFQYRLKAISALKDHPANIAVPLLVNHLRDPEFLVRSFVARELGKQKTAESFGALLQVMRLDGTPNVRAEAANSLSLFGNIAAAHLVQLFFMDDHWLVRRTVLAALVEMECPEEVLEVCKLGLDSYDTTIQESSVDGLAALARSRQSDAALAILLELSHSQSSRMRVRVAQALDQFEAPAAKTALSRLLEASLKAL